MEYNRYVKEAQEALIGAGYAVGSKGADGMFGAKTLEAVKKAIGAADGAGRTSEESTEAFTVVEAYPFVRQLKIGDTGVEVIYLQRLLIKWHMEHYLGEAADDGVFGSGTRSAVTEFQKGMSLKPDGTATEETWELLNLEPIDISRWSARQSGGQLPMECNCNGRYCESAKNAQPGVTSVGLVLLIERIQKAMRKKHGREDIEVLLTDDMDTSDADDRNGGNRCETWNRLHGGAANSQHTKWRAADLFVKCADLDGMDCPNTHSLWEAADELNPYGGVGEYGHNIHVDTRGSRARW